MVPAVERFEPSVAAGVQPARRHEEDPLAQMPSAPTAFASSAAGAQRWRPAWPPCGRRLRHRTLPGLVTAALEGFCWGKAAAAGSPAVEIDHHWRSSPRSLPVPGERGRYVRSLGIVLVWRHPPRRAKGSAKWVSSARRSAGPRARPSRRDAELSQQAPCPAERTVAVDEQPFRNLVGGEVVVLKEQDLRSSRADSAAAIESGAP